LTALHGVDGSVVSESPFRELVNAVDALVQPYGVKRMRQYDDSDETSRMALAQSQH
jgi:hypothetical protein